MPSLPPRPAAKPGSVVSPQKGAAHKATATIDTSKNSLPGHHSASRRPEAFQSLPPTDGETVEADVLEGTVVAASSHKGDGGAGTGLVTPAGRGARGGGAYAQYNTPHIPLPLTIIRVSLRRGVVFRVCIETGCATRGLRGEAQGADGGVRSHALCAACVRENIRRVCR